MGLTTLERDQPERKPRERFEDISQRIEAPEESRIKKRYMVVGTVLCGVVLHAFAPEMVEHAAWEALTAGVYTSLGLGLGIAEQRADLALKLGAIAPLGYLAGSGAAIFLELNTHLTNALPHLQEYAVNLTEYLQ